MKHQLKLEISGTTDPEKTGYIYNNMGNENNGHYGQIQQRKYIKKIMNNILINWKISMVQIISLKNPMCKNCLKNIKPKEIHRY